MSDPNAPSWLTTPEAAPTARPTTPVEKTAKSGGVFRMFTKEAATAHAQKAVVEHATQQTNILSAPDDGFTPAWATAKAYTPPHDIENAGSSGGIRKDDAAPTAQDVSKPLEIDPETLKRMQFYHRILRILYMVASAVMGTAAGLSLVLQTNISAAFFAIYVLFFCLLMCCFEVGLSLTANFIAVNFGFMYTLSGRLVFLLFVGFMSFSLSTFGIAAMVLLYIVGLLHALLMCKFPKFSEYVRQQDFYSKRAAKQ